MPLNAKIGLWVAILVIVVMVIGFPIAFALGKV